MPSHRFFTPDARRLIELYAIALGEFTWPDDHDGDHRLTFDDMGLTGDPSAADRLSERLAQLTSRPYPSLESLLSDIAVYTARAGVVRVHDNKGTQRLGAYAAMMLVGELASKCGYLVEDLKGVFNILARQRPTQARMSIRAWLGEHLIPHAEPPVRYLVLTPLTQPSGDDQDDALAVADLLEVRADLAGLIIDAPGRRLPVGATNNWTSELMFGIEREHILGADVVLIVAGPAHSYGAGQSQSWAEANLARVFVVSSHTSRSLGAGYWGTSATPWVNAADAAEWAAALTTQELDEIAAHACESAAIRRAWTKYVLLPAPRFLHDESVVTSLPRRRVDALASAPVEVMSLSAREIVELRKADPSGFGSSIGAMYAELGLPIGVDDSAGDRERTGRPGAVEVASGETATGDQGLDQNAPLTVEAILAARPMRSPERRTLRDFCKAEDITAAELNILLAFADNRFEPAMSHRSTLEEADLSAWLSTIRSERARDDDGGVK